MQRVEAEVLTYEVRSFSNMNALLLFELDSRLHLPLGSLTKVIIIREVGNREQSKRTKPRNF